MMKQNKKTIDSNNYFLQPEGLMDEELNDAVAVTEFLIPRMTNKQMYQNGNQMTVIPMKQ